MIISFQFQLWAQYAHSSHKCVVILVTLSQCLFCTNIPNLDKIHFILSCFAPCSIYWRQTLATRGAIYLISLYKSHVVKLCKLGGVPHNRTVVCIFKTAVRSFACKFSSYNNIKVDMFTAMSKDILEIWKMIKNIMFCYYKIYYWLYFANFMQVIF